MKIEDKQIARLFELCGEIAAVEREMPAPPKGFRVDAEIGRQLRASLEKHDPALREIATILAPLLHEVPEVIVSVETESERAARLASYDDVNRAPRSPEEIAELLKHENSEETQRRIRNDQARHAARASRRDANPQGAIIDLNAQYSGNESWTRR